MNMEHAPAEDSAAIPAATLILVRDRPDGAPHLLLVERAAGLAFAGGAVVFPGGRVDPGDIVLAADPALVAHAPADPSDAAGRVAAIRETLEEAGIAVGFASPPDPRSVAAMRTALHAGGGFAEVLRSHGARLDLSLLRPWARWRPNFKETRTFDTRFYLAADPPGSGEPGSDGGETVRAFWASAADVLARADRGDVSIIFPTRRNLERIAPHPSHAALDAHAAAHRPRLIVPAVEDRDGVPTLTIPDDLGYPVTAEPMATVRRR